MSLRDSDNRFPEKLKKQSPRKSDNKVLEKIIEFYRKRRLNSRERSFSFKQIENLSNSDHKVLETTRIEL